MRVFFSMLIYSHVHLKRLTCEKQLTLQTAVVWVLLRTSPLCDPHSEGWTRIFCRMPFLFQDFCLTNKNKVIKYIFQNETFSTFRSIF